MLCKMIPEDLENATHSNCNCPIARMLERITGRHTWVSKICYKISTKPVFIGFYLDHMIRFPMPCEGQDYVNRYDSLKPVGLLEIELPIEPLVIQDYVI